MDDHQPDASSRRPEPCPFCGFSGETDYQIMLHLETMHAEDDAGFAGDREHVLHDDASIAAVLALEQQEQVDAAGDERDRYVECPAEGCGEAVALAEIESHAEMHAAEREGTGEGDHDDDDGDEDEGKRSTELRDSSKRSSGGAIGATAMTKRLSMSKTSSRTDRAPRDDHGKLDKPDGSDTFDVTLSPQLRNLHSHRRKRSADESLATDSKISKQGRAKAAWKNLLHMPEAPSMSASASVVSVKKQLGKAELGPYAHERTMPKSLRKLLEQDGMVKMERRTDRHGQVEVVPVPTNHVPGIIPVIAQLLDMDQHTSLAYLCDPSVKHISKIWREGGFCGYRNIQMLCSYIIATQSQGHDHFRGRIPSIFDIQDYIEKAWDMGINSSGRTETGGIRGSRKYIGTPDAQAMMASLNIACKPHAIRAKVTPRVSAYEQLLGHVKTYFAAGCTSPDSGSIRVHSTPLPPIYFQHRGHSMTIIGYEEMRDGARHLLVFDPMFHDSATMLRNVGRTVRRLKWPGDRLRAYRRGGFYLKRYKEFELLMLTPPGLTDTIKAMRESNMQAGNRNGMQP